MRIRYDPMDLYVEKLERRKDSVGKFLNNEDSDVIDEWPLHARDSVETKNSHLAESTASSPPPAPTPNDVREVDACLLEFNRKFPTGNSKSV